MKHPNVIIKARAAHLAFDDAFLLVRQDFLLLNIGAGVALLSILSISSSDEDDSLPSFSRASFSSTCLSLQSFGLGGDCDEVVLLVDVSADSFLLLSLSLNHRAKMRSWIFSEGSLFQKI